MPAQGFVSLILPFHIIAGVLALVFGYLALAAAKGATLHCKSGRLFVYAMVVLSLTGALVAALTGSPVSVVAGLLTFYFVTTALLTLIPRAGRSGWLDAAATIAALLTSLMAFKTGFDAAGTGRPETVPMFIFGIVGVLAANGDRRMIRDGVQGTARIARHLWRMCFGMWVAAASFFWGPRGRVPDVIDIGWLKTIAVLTPVAVMVFWLWRLRIRKTARGIVTMAPQPAALEKL